MGDTKHHTTASSPTSPPSRDSGDQPIRASRIHLRYDSDSHNVVAQLTPDPHAPSLSVELLRRQLADEGYGEYFAPDEGLQSVVQKANRAESGEYVIAERRDAHFDWTISADKTAVDLTVAPARGGTAPTRAALHPAITHPTGPGRCTSWAAWCE